MNIQDLYHDLIVEHGTTPRNHHSLPNATCSARGTNPLCGDNVTVYLHCVQDIIADISFEGSGCAISIASASLLTEVLKNKNIAYALQLFTNFHNLLTKENSTTIEPEKLNAFANVRNYPIRIKCATLAWHALRDALSSYVFTEKSGIADTSQE